MADGKVVYEVEADDSKIGKQLDDTGKKIEKHSSGWAGAAKGTAKAIGTAFTATAVAVTGAVVSFSKKGIELASDLSEVQNVVDTTFGKSSKTIDKFAKDAATAYGLSELQAKQFSSTIGAMTKSMGLSQDEVTKMSIGLTGLAGDMGSFYNLAPEEAFEKLRSGISGETEPLKQLGINMSQANLEAFALKEGINKSWNEMTQAEQATLRYNYIMAATKDAQGDFAKTSGSLANQQKIAKMQFDSLAAEMGGILLPVVTKAMQSFNDLMKNNTGLKDGLKLLFESIAKIAETALPVLIDAFNKFMPLVVQLASGILPPLVQLFSAILPVIIEIAQAVLPVIVELFGAIVPILVQLIESILPPLLSILQAVMPILELVGQLLMPILQLVTSLIGPILELVSALIGPLLSALKPVIEIISKVLTPVINALKTVFSEVFGFIIRQVQGSAETLGKIVGSIVGFFKGFAEVFRSIWNGVSSFFKGIWEGIVNAFKTPVNWIIDGINKFLKGLNKIKIPDFVPGIGGKGFHINLIPRLQKGEDEVMEDWSPAYLDRGERVLTREQNIKFKSMGGLAGMEQLLSGNLALSMGSNAPVAVAVSSPVYLDGQLISKSVTQHQYDDMMVRRTR